MRKARVFISCGQRDQREVNIGKAVEDYFKKRQFETYFAERVHSPDALTENIFKFLRQSEYFIFIDFKREKITNIDNRGSLFVNQEAAIATFLKINGLGFYEIGTKREGILDYHIYNAFSFQDGTEIIKILEAESKNWDIHSANELYISYDDTLTSRNVTLNNDPRKPLSDWYHLDILNRNKDKHALSCLAYVTNILDVNNNKEYEIPSCELVWAGIGDIMVNIAGGTRRELDAFYLIHPDSMICFHHRRIMTTNQRYWLPRLPAGKYEIEYAIISSNFVEVSKKYVLEFGGSPRDVRFTGAK